MYLPFGKNLVGFCNHAMLRAFQFVILRKLTETIDKVIYFGELKETEHLMRSEKLCLAISFSKRIKIVQVKIIYTVISRKFHPSNILLSANGEDTITHVSLLFQIISS